MQDQDSGRVIAPLTERRASRAPSLILQQVAVLLASLLVASLVIFGAIEILPGDQATILAGTEATPEQTARIRAELGLDRPAPVRYLDWLGGALHGDLGTSLLNNRSVSSEIAEKMAVTLPLCVLALVLSILAAVPMGMVAAVGRERWYGRALGAFTQLGVAAPTFVVGLLLVLLISVQLRWLPVQGFPAYRWEDPVAALRHLILPAVTLAIPQTAVLLRFVRSATIDVLGQDWLRTARAQGWTLPVVLVRQGLRNAALPLISVAALELAGLLMGSVIIEQVFSLPGIGQMILSDVGNRDLNKIQGTLLALTGAIMTITLLLDLLYRLVDPRLVVRR